MLVMFDFAVTQTRYVKAAMNQITTFRPDAKVPADVETMLTDAGLVRGTYVTKNTTLGTARAVRRDTIAILHDSCVDFATQAGSAFRKNRVIKEQIDRLPVDDKTFQETITRADETLALWSTLPDVPHAGSGDAPFTYMEGNDPIDIDLFGSRKDAAKAADDDIPVKDQDFQKAEALLHAKENELEDFVTAAIRQGTQQFDPGTPEREIIDAIPTTPPQHAPGSCEITSAEPAGAGTVHMVFECEFATGFDVFDLAPGATDPVQVKDDEIGTEFDVTGLAPGVHTLTARGVNARGRGPMSVAVTVTVS
jgi:hypothetical protein